MMSFWADWLLLITLAVCAVTDWQRRKIYNALIFPVLAAALLLHAATGGWDGFLFGAAGFGVGAGLLLIPYALGGIGAGDVKLLAAVGALKGASFVLSAALAMGIIGGIMAMVVLCRSKGARGIFTGFLYTIAARRHGVPVAAPSQGTAGGIALPYGIAIAGGTVAALVWGEWLV